MSQSQSESSTDVLLRVLVRKGILSEEEASEVRQEVSVVSQYEQAAIVEEAVQEFQSASMPMPSNLSGLKLYGDARFRYQYENAEKISGENNDRSRWRYRARFGADMTFAESGFSMGARLETSSSNDSTNVNYGGFFDKAGDELYLGLAYLRYQNEVGDFYLGKHKQPFYLSKAFWDSDINPEGLSESFSAGNWTFTSGQYIIDEERESRSPSSEDDYLIAAQANWTDGEGLVIAPIVMATSGGSSENSESATFKGENAIKSFHDFFVIALPFEYSFSGGGQKQKIFGTLGKNLEADKAVADIDSPFYGGPDSDDQDLFFNLGYQVGSAKKAGAWQYGLEYRYIEGAAFTPNLTDSDFAKNHTNQHGFVFSAAYGVTDFFTTALTYMKSDTIDSDYSSPVADAGDVQVLQIDGNVKF